MPLTCLIAAHDPWFIQLLRIYSEESGFRVVQVYEGQEVLPVIDQEKPAVIFLQADLPGKVKGLEVLRSIKAHPLARHIPVLVCSWLAQPVPTVLAADSPETISEGASAYLQEPVTYEIFQEALRKVGIGRFLPSLTGAGSFEPPAVETPFSSNNR